MERTDASLIALRRILRATELYGRDLARAARLTPAQFRVLQIVAETGQAIPKDIAARMQVSQATVTALVDKLVTRAMVTRVRSETDRRQMNVVITEAGQHTAEHAPDALQQRYVREFERLDDWEQAQIVSTLERVAAMLDAHDMEAPPVLAVGEIADSDSKD